jgi:hypothetical protein
MGWGDLGHCQQGKNNAVRKRQEKNREKLGSLMKNIKAKYL